MNDHDATAGEALAYAALVPALVWIGSLLIDALAYYNPWGF